MTNLLVATVFLASTWTVVSSLYVYNSCKNVPKPESPCEVCDRCNNGRWECERVSCLQAQCADGYYEKGNCCYTCPNGQNCKIYETIIPKGQTVGIDKMNCTCSEDPDGQLGAVCLLPSH